MDAAVAQPAKGQKQWGPKVQGGRGGGGANGKGQNPGKWSGVDPVIFITDETILNSLVEFYGLAGPSEGIIRSQLVRLF